MEDKSYLTSLRVPLALTKYAASNMHIWGALRSLSPNDSASKFGGCPSPFNRPVFIYNYL